MDFLHRLSKSDVYPYSRQQVDYLEVQQLDDAHRAHLEFDNHEFPHYYGSPQLEILDAQENLEDRRPDHQNQSQPTPFNHNQTYSPTTLQRTPDHVEPFNHGRRRKFDEFAHEERVEMNRAHQPLVLPGRVYVPPMDLRNLNPEEAHALREHVLELRRQNLEAELRGSFNQDEARGQGWPSYLLGRLVLVGATMILVPAAFVCGVLYGAIKSGRFAYQNRHHIHGTFTLVVESTYNAAKRRIVTVSGLISVPRRRRLNLRPSSPRRRNGVVRQPPMTSNLARWEDELRAQREELSMAMQGVESDSTGVSDFMMSGAIMDLDEVDCINPHYNPLYIPLKIDTTALDACVRDIVHPNALLASFATSRSYSEDGDICMNDLDDLTAQQHSETVQQGFTDFSPFHLVESYGSRSGDHIVSAGGPGSIKTAIISNADAVASSSSEPATYQPTDIIFPLSPDNNLSTSIPAFAIGATDSDASSISEPPAEFIIPKSQQVSNVSTNHESLMSNGVDDTYSDLSDDTKQQELPLCDFQGDNEQSIFMEIHRATNANMELGLDDSIASDDGTESSSAQPETSILESTAPPQTVLASNVIHPRQSKDKQLPHTAANFSVESNGEQTISSSSTYQSRTQSQEPEVSHSLKPAPRMIQGEEFDSSSIAPTIPRENHQPLMISASQPIQTEGQEDPPSPGYFDEDQGKDQLLSRPYFEITEQQALPATPIVNPVQHGISPLIFSSTHGFEQGNIPLSSEQLDSSIPISSVQILEQESSGQTTPTQNDGQQSPLSLTSPMELPHQQGSPSSPARSKISLPATSTPSQKQRSPKSNMNSAKRIVKKRVDFFHSPKTGRPITKTKKYILGESMDFPVSSSPAPSSVASTEDSILEFDSPTTIAETEGLVHSFAQHDPSTPISGHHLAEEVASEEEREFETVSLVGRPSESAGILTSEIRNNEERTLEVTEPVEGSLEADKPALATQTSEIAADSSLIQPVTPFVETQFKETMADHSFTMLDEAAAAETDSAGTRLIEADKSTAESTGTILIEESPAARADGPVDETQSADLTADKVVIEKDSTQQMAGSSLGEAGEPAEEKGVASGRNEDIATISEKFPLRQLRKTSKPGKPEPLRRKSSPNRQSVQPARKSLRLKSRSARISPPAPAKTAEKLAVLDLSGGYGTTSTTSKHHTRLMKEEQARARQAAIKAAEEAQRRKREAEEAKEKARVAKEKAEEKARKEQEEEEERQRKATRRFPRGKVIQPLTAEWEAKVQAAMDTPDMRSVLVTLPSGTTLTRKDFGTLKVVPGRDPAHGWLNDEIILASLQHVVDYGLRMSNHQTGKTPKYHAFNTFFYKNLRDKGAQSIKRWATKAKIGGRALEEVERVFIPVHQGAHWTLLVVSPVTHTIEYFDSLGGSADSYIRNAKLWLAAEMGARFKESEWAVPTGTHGVGPRQTNMSDCGVFTCTTARMVALGVDPMAYGGEDMGVQRGRMVAELLNGGLFGDFDPKVEF